MYFCFVISMSVVLRSIVSTQLGRTHRLVGGNTNTTDRTQTQLSSTTMVPPPPIFPLQLLREGESEIEVTKYPSPRTSRPARRAFQPAELQFKSVLWDQPRSGRESAIISYSSCCSQPLKSAAIFNKWMTATREPTCYYYSCCIHRLGLPPPPPPPVLLLVVLLFFDEVIYCHSQLKRGQTMLHFAI